MKRSLKIGSLLVVVAAFFVTGIPIPTATAQDQGGTNVTFAAPVTVQIGGCYPGYSSDGGKG